MTESNHEPRHAKRGDLQGLRALAVLLVLLFHVWPDAIPGGYVGVDVFFVISGYLIVGSLAREAERTGTVSLLAFYTRRVRRLLPAATAVLLCVFAAMFLWLPEARWQDTVSQIAASALYVENWFLGFSAVDYLAAENAASPVQHYWSLSIEEQFYIVWPLLVLGIAMLARHIGLSTRKALGITILLVLAASLIASILITAENQAWAYFVSHTRAWELALGGAAAIWLPRFAPSAGKAALMFLAGFAAVVASALLYNTATPFPGYTALLPTVGALLIILAGPFRLLGFRGLDIAPLRYLGDISYSLYLWHWPLIVFYDVNYGPIDLTAGLALIAVTLVVAHLSYVLIEERFRHPDRPVQFRPLATGLASILVVVAATAISYLTIGERSPVAAMVAGETALYPGPGALLDGLPVPEGVPLRPDPAQLRSDRAVVYDNGCHQNQDDSAVLHCVLGDPDGTVTVAVIGSSHAVSWLPAVDLLGRKNGWKVISITKSACNFHDTTPESCNAWQDNVLTFLKDNPVKIAIIAEQVNVDPSPEQIALVARRLRAMTDLGITIVALRPTPRLPEDPGDCIPDQLERCEVARAEAEPLNIFVPSAEGIDGVHLVDLSNGVCGPQTCGAVVGNLVVFRDKHHLTATFAQALAPYLERELAQIDPELPVRADASILSGAAEVPDRPRLECGAVGTSKGFARTYDLEIANGEISFRSGDWEQRQDDYEVWDGQLDGDVLTITGSYREGSASRASAVELVGTVQDGIVVAAGTRGRRTCSLLWTL